MERTLGRTSLQAPRDTVTLAIAGDVMLGRLLDRYIWSDSQIDPAYIWGDTKELWLQHDLRLMNLECVIATKCDDWRRAPKVFTFCARPRALEALAAIRTDFVALANNHVLDFGVDALIEMLDLLDRHGIARAGAGRTLAEALRPAQLAAGGLTVGVVSLTDNEPGWEAGETSPGVSYIDYDERGLREPYLSRMTQLLGETRQQADLVIVSAHIGPNWGEPSAAMRALAHQLIDLGADLYWGHSNHSTRGIELYQGKPILYSTGDFVDDYAVDPDERNDLSFLFGVVVERTRIRRLQLFPVKIDRFQVNRAPDDEAAWVMDWMRKRCKPFGTTPAESDGTLVLDLESNPSDGSGS
ncbi:MAG: CapA family protein [Chloroflexi bacterium]|nr:CapA family protein [Chloroflexota bacterium]